MKKRGHKPSAQTITIMLRGYMENTRTPNAVQQALTVYNSIFAPNSTVKPSIIHTNAILSVCAKGRDMGSLWSIAGRLPERGPDTADHRTYTTILTAITADARERALKLGSKEQRQPPDKRSLNTDTIFEQAIEDGHRLWTEVITRWRKGDLEIDGKLTCAMGRLLMLSSKRKHHHEIFALVEQTMNLGVVAQNREVAQKEVVAQTNTDSEPKNTPQGTAQSLHEDTPNQEDLSIVSKSSSTRELPPKALSTAPKSAFALPDNNTLSMLIDTALSLRDVERGKQFWRIITSPTGPYMLAPDPGSITTYLRLLRVSRASQESLSVLKSIPHTLWKIHMAFKGVFVIAMSTCVRDKNNPNVFDTAGQIIDLMQEKAEKYEELAQSREAGVRNRRVTGTMSPKVLTLFLQLAMATTHGLDGQKLTKIAKSGDLDFERDARKNNALRALNRLSPETLNVKQIIKLNVAEYERQLNEKSRTPMVQRRLREQAAAPDSTQELMEYLTTLISVYDKLLMINEQLEDEGMGPLDTKTLTDIAREKRKLSAFVGMVNNVPGMASRYEKIKAFLEPQENEDEDSRTGSSDVIESSAQKEIKQEIEKEAEKQDRKNLLKGLSIRQRHEFQKELYIRSVDTLPSQHPWSASRSVHIPLSSISRRIPIPQDDPSPGSRRIQVPQGDTSYVSKRVPIPQDDSTPRTRRDRIHKSDFKNSKSPYADLPRVEGWGGGFRELAKKEGQSTSGLVDIGSH